MCRTKVSKRYNAWINKQEIHPFWLRLKDKELEEKVVKQKRTQVFLFVKITVALVFVYGFVTLLFNYDQSFEEWTRFALNWGQSMFFYTVFMLLIKFKLAFADYVNLMVLMTTSISAFL